MDLNYWKSFPIKLRDLPLVRSVWNVLFVKDLKWLMNVFKLKLRKRLWWRRIRKQMNFNYAGWRFKRRSCIYAPKMNIFHSGNSLLTNTLCNLQTNEAVTWREGNDSFLIFALVFQSENLNNVTFISLVLFFHWKFCHFDITPN